MIILNPSWKTACFGWNCPVHAKQGEPGLVRFDEDERAAVADGDDLGARADQGGHEAHDVAGQRAARAAQDGGRKGWVHASVGAAAAELPPVGRIESLAEDLRRPWLADGGQVEAAGGRG